ncbi:MAG: glycosyltransferase family 4 protein [Crocinitomicaceae bacterium]|nr:glycosyltransferase family 4 protein [Crocinitomicaceae bacterium]
MKRIVEAHPEHEFYFYFDRSYDQKFIFGENVKGFVLPPQARHPILFKWWFNGSVSRAMRKHKPDVFFSPDGYLSLKTSVPQVAVIHDLNFEHHPEDLPRNARLYLKKYFPRFARKADHIITVSEFSKQDIISTYGIDSEKITVAHNGGSEEFRPLLDEEKQIVRDQLTDGKSYFVFVGALHPRKNVPRLFKAFEKFKSDTNSQTKLVIVGEKMFRNTELETLYNKLSVKADIIFTGHLSSDRLTQVVGGARSLVFPSYFEGFGIPLVEAMKAHCPIICGNKTALPEVVGDAAVLVDPYSVVDLASAMIKVNTDSELRRALISKGAERSKLFSWDQTAKKIWDVLQAYEN